MIWNCADDDNDFWKSSTQLNDARQFQSISLLIKAEYISIQKKSSSNFSVTLETSSKVLFIIHSWLHFYCNGDDYKYSHCVFCESLQWLFESFFWNTQFLHSVCPSQNIRLLDRWFNHWLCVRYLSTQYSQRYMWSNIALDFLKVKNDGQPLVKDQTVYVFFFFSPFPNRELGEVGQTSILGLKMA